MAFAVAADLVVITATSQPLVLIRQRTRSSTLFSVATATSSTRHRSSVRDSDYFSSAQSIVGIILWLLFPASVSGIYRTNNVNVRCYHQIYFMRDNNK